MSQIESQRPYVYTLNLHHGKRKKEMKIRKGKRTDKKKEEV